MGEGSADDAEEHVPLGVMAPASESEEEGSRSGKRQTSNAPPGSKTSDDVLGAFDEA